MKIHKEAQPTLIITLIVVGVIELAFFITYRESPLLFVPFTFLTSFLILLVIWFFRVPNRSPVTRSNAIISPADGKVVVIEETVENEYFKDKRIQISIFMSPLNVHINWFPVSGTVKYYKYHKGKYLVAFNPKSSTENERTTVVVEKSNGTAVLFRQIAGAVARRIVCYTETGQKAEQGEEFGFIKFGSRVDIFLPLDAKINVNLDDKVLGRQTVLAELKE